MSASSGYRRSKTKTIKVIKACHTTSEIHLWSVMKNIKRNWRNNILNSRETKFRYIYVGLTVKINNEGSFKSKVIHNHYSLGIPSLVKLIYFEIVFFFKRPLWSDLKTLNGTMIKNKLILNPNHFGLKWIGKNIFKVKTNINSLGNFCLLAKMLSSFW